MAKQYNHNPKLAFGLSLMLIVSCGPSPKRPNMDSQGATGAKNVIPGEGGTSPLPQNLKFDVPGQVYPKRVWRLTNAQYAESVNSLLNKPTQIGTMFDAEPMPSGGFGHEAEMLLAAGSFASKLEIAVYNTIKSSQSDLEKQLSCKKFSALDDKCLEDFIGAFASKAFRRPATSDEIARYKKVYSSLIAKKLSKEESVSAVAEAVLRSPFTFFRFELGENGQKGNQKLNPFELAQALSFALTNSPPDATLLAKAQDGTLADDKVYIEEAKRLLASEGFIKAFSDYAMRWSGAQWLSVLSKDEKLFPEFKADLKSAMMKEIEAFAQETVKNGANFNYFMTSDVTTITPPLADHYSVSKFEGTKVIEKSDGQRSGIITLPGVLAAHSGDSETAPMARAVFLMDKLACSPPPPAPDRIDSPGEKDPNATVREQFAAHAQGSCQACHVSMDPFAFSLGNYDPIGRYQTEDKGKPIDASGTLVSPKITFKNAVELLDQSANDSKMQACFVSNAFRYVNGRVDGEGDAKLIENALNNFKAAKLDMTAVFLTLVMADSFKTRSDGQEVKDEN